MTPRAGVVLALVLLLAACDPLTSAEQRTVRRWLLCEECIEGERDSVVALRDRAVKSLRRALRGPPETGRENIRLQSEAMYQRVRQPALTQQDYVNHYVGNYVATYQSRAAIALHDIGTLRARAALIDALRNDVSYREDVRRVLGESVGALVSVAVGDSQHAPVDSFVKVDPVILVRDSANGEGLGGIRVLFRVDSGNGTVSDSVRFTAMNGTAVVRWSLGPSDSVVNVLRAVAAGRTARLRAFGHPYGLRVVFLVQPSNGVAGEPITPPVRIAVQDAWASTDTSFHQSAIVTVVGTTFESAHNIVAGVADMPALSIPKPRTGYVLRVEVPDVGQAFSEPFDIAP